MNAFSSGDIVDAVQLKELHFSESSRLLSLSASPGTHIWESSDTFVNRQLDSLTFGVVGSTSP
jgi:hypothetical protein